MYNGNPQMSNKNANRNSNKWLISRLKTSGSKKKYVDSADFADERHSKRRQNWADLPMREGMGRNAKAISGKINYGLLVRFLEGKVGQQWETIHAEILERIPTKLKAYKDCVYWFVADLVEVQGEAIWDKREQKYLRMDPDAPHNFDQFAYKKFYVNPDNGQLTRIPTPPSSKYTKQLNESELRKFREEQQQVARCRKQIQQAENDKLEQKTQELLSQHNRHKKDDSAAAT